LYVLLYGEGTVGTISLSLLTQSVSRLQCRKRVVKQKLSYVGHILRGSSGDNILLILEDKIYGKKARRRPRRMGMDDTYESANKTYGEVKRLAADGETWRKMIVTHQTSD